MWLAKSLQSCLTPQTNGLFATPPGSFAHGKLQARMLEWVAITFSRGESSWPRARTHVSYVSWIGRWVSFTTSATWEAPDHPLCLHVAFWNSIKDSTPASHFQGQPHSMCLALFLSWKVSKSSLFSLAKISVNCFTTKVSSRNKDNNNFS